MSRIDYKIDSIIPIGFSRAMVRYSVFEGEIAAQVEPVVDANGTTSNQSVTTYRRESRTMLHYDESLTHCSKPTRTIPERRSMSR